MRRAALAALALLAIGGILSPLPALAHKMKVFAAAEGADIAGYVYFSPGADRAVQVTITVSDGSGSVLYQGTTDDEGAFRFRATLRTDHHVAASGADGHAASYTLRAAELPESLPAAPAGSTAAVPAPAATATPAPPTATAEAAELRAVVERAVAQQLRPLREQIDGWYEKIWWHDVLGGLGYIVGVAGLAYGLARHRTRTPGG